MKYTLLSTFILIFSFYTNAFALDITFADDDWDGVTIPNGQQCQKFGGINPATPRWIVSNIPIGSDTIILEYSDRDSKKMDKGGHGRMLFPISPTATQTEIPSVPGHTFIIPSQFAMIEAHRGAGWDIDGAYMPPCSGGKNHAYYVTIKTVKGDLITAEMVVEMGKY